MSLEVTVGVVGGNHIDAASTYGNMGSVYYAQAPTRARLPLPVRTRLDRTYRRTMNLNHRTERSAVLSHRMYLSISFRKSTPPQNRQLHILISGSKQYVADFVGELTF